MASIFSRPDEARCRHYARWASHLDRSHFDGVYWTLFVVVLLLLCTASAVYMRTMESIAKYQPRTPEYTHRLKLCIVACGVLAILSVVAVVLEVFMLMALQFCDGEDLMSLYWSTWTMLQVGSLIAVFGILLHVFYMLRGRKHPPWALALGTPVLVVAGVSYILHSAMGKRIKPLKQKIGSVWRSILPKTMSTSQGIQPDTSASGELAMSPSETIRIDSELENSDAKREDDYNARLIGFTPEGGPILQFRESRPPPFPPTHAMVIGTNDEGHVTVAIRREMTTILGSKSGSGSGSGSSNQTSPSTIPDTPLKSEATNCTLPLISGPILSHGSASSGSMKVTDDREPVLSFSLPTLDSISEASTPRSVYQQPD